jgi:hypothetical protein
VQRTNRANRPDERCDCESYLENRRLRIDATDCTGRGRIATNPTCRATAIAALDGSVTAIATTIGSTESSHDEGTVGTLVAAARFAALVGDHDPALAGWTYRYPFRAARAALARGGRVGELAAVTGMAEAVHRNGYGATELNPLTSPAATEPMLHDIDDAGDLAPEELRARYDERLRAVIDEHGVETVEAETGVENIEVLADGDSPSMTLDEAATILALDPDEPDADAIVTETRDHLLMGMTTAVLDVEAVESGIDGSLDAREIQQKIEGRLPMSLDELALIHGHIEQRKP